MRIDNLSNTIIAQYIQDERLRRDKPPEPVMAQYIQDEQLESDEERSGRSKSLHNPPVLQHRTNGLLTQRDRSSAYRAAPVALSSRNPGKSLQPAAVFYPEYDSGGSTFQADDQFLINVRTAYTGQDSSNYKGVYVDTRV